MGYTVPIVLALFIIAGIAVLVINIDK